MGAKAAGVVGVEDEAGDFVGLVGDEGFVEEGGEREIGEGHLGGDALDGAAGGDASEFIAGARRVALARRSLRSRSCR